MGKSYKNKYFSIMGDSISTFDGYLPFKNVTYYSYYNAYDTGVISHKDTWWDMALNRLGGKLLVNNSWSGSVVCKPEKCEIESYGCSDERTGHLGEDGISPDVIIVFMGTNDRGMKFPIHSEDKDDLTAIENAYGVMLDKIKNNYPSAEIWCCTLPVNTCPSAPNFVFPTNFFGVPTEAFCDVIISVAAQKNCNIIELRGEELCPTVEGIHPDINGMKYIADKVVNALLNKGK